jgi:archaellum component FlaF (FlaF/FlaG flagellin family)
VALSIAAAALCTLGASSARAVNGPTPQLTPDAIDFGSVQVGSVSDVVEVTLSNTGSGPLSISRFGVASSSANPRDFWVAPGGTCSTSAPLAAGESCIVRVRFNPIAPGARSGLLSFWVNTAAGRINATLGGTALAAPQPALMPDAIDFGTLQVGSASSITDVTLSNTGGGPLSFWRFGIASSSVNPRDFWVAPGGTCSVATPLAAGESCTVRVRFNPVDVGVRMGLLSFWVNTPSGRIDAALTGAADPAPQPELTPAAIDFGSVAVGAVSDVVDVTVSNAGGGTLSFSRFGIASSSANPSDFWVAPGGTCSTALPLSAGESCTVRVRFNPTGIGPRSGLLSFWVNTPAGRIDAALTGWVDDPCAAGCF